MLSDKLKGRVLFAAVEAKPVGEKEEALDLLEACVDNLILGMKTIEDMGLFPREDVEDYVLSYMEEAEKRYYGAGEDELDRFIRELLKRG